MNPIPHPRRHIDKRYRTFVKSEGCVLFVERAPCTGPIDAHHVRPVGGGIMGSKVSDLRCVGLCRFHHDMVGRYPVSHRDILEAAIVRLNRAYRALHPPKAKKQRERPAKLKITGICAKGHETRVPLAKLQTKKDAALFWCGRCEEYVEAS